MKQVFLTGTMLLAFAVASFSQTTADQSNKASVAQGGEKQTASVQQTGNNLQSSISQDQGGSSNYGNYAFTNQTSTGSAGNQAIIDQNSGSISSRAGITQSGGTGNKGVITQGHSTSSFVRGSLVVVTAASTKDDLWSAGGNWADITQKGNNNKDVSINQSNSLHNTGEITQYSNNSRLTQIDQSNSTYNTARINQGTAQRTVSANQATIKQGYSQNQASIDQLSNGNVSTVEQGLGVGYENQVTIKQIGNFGYETAQVKQRDNASGNQATVTQSGFGDFAYVNQTDNSNSNQATINQQSTAGGFGNVATINQQFNSTRNQATLTQDGINNEATISQFNATTGKATIAQNLATAGFGKNKAEIVQGNTDAAQSQGNTASITQEYSNNIARLQQTGLRNDAVLSQTGNNNLIKGLGDSPYALQQGNDNKLTISQDSGTSNFVTNVANVSQIGNSNTATITQTGRQ